MLETILVGVVAAVAVVSWGVSFVAWLALLPKRRADISLNRMLFYDNLCSLRRDTFRPEAARLWRLHVTGLCVFVVSAVAIPLAGLLAGLLFPA